MSRHDGQITSIDPFLRSTSIDIEEIKNEIQSLHLLMDRLGVARYGDSTSAGPSLTLASRLEKLLFTDHRWEAVKKEEQQGG